MSPENTVKAILAELYRQVGHGRLGRLQRALNVSKNFFSYWKRHPATVRLLPIAKALEYLEIEPATFFAAVFKLDAPSNEGSHPDGSDGSSPPKLPAPTNEYQSFFKAAFAAETNFPSGVPPLGVQKAVERMAATSARDAGPRIRTKERMDHQELVRLDALRWDDPGEVNGLLEQAFDDSPLELLAEILLLYGATFRQLDQLAAARWAYLVGEMRAKEVSDRGTLAKIFQWRSEVEFSDGNCSGALELLRKAAGIYSELGEPNQEATVLVHIAIQYIKQEKFEEAMTCATSALQKLDKDDYWYRFSVHQALAGCSKALGDIGATLQNLEAARALLMHCPRSVTIRFVWLEATLKKDILPLETAATVFEEAAAFFVEIGEVLTASLAMLEFVNCLLALGNHQELSRVASVLKGFAFKLDDCKSSSRLSAAALMGVYRAILCGAVSEALVTSAAHAIQSAAGALATPAAPLGG